MGSESKRASVESECSSTDMALLGPTSFKNMRATYSKLLLDEKLDLQDLKEQRAHKPLQHLRKNITVYILSTLVIFLSMLSIALYINQPAQRPAPSFSWAESDHGHHHVENAPHIRPTYIPEGTQFIEIGNCGNSTEEAKALDCIFDVMSYRWVTRACFDAELAAEFRQHWDNPWYTDFRARPQDVLPYELVETGEYDTFTDWLFHLRHCTFMWRKMHRALLNGWPIEERILNMEHTVHCEDMLLQLPDFNPTDVTTETTRDYTRCLQPII